MTCIGRAGRYADIIPAILYGPLKDLMVQGQSVRGFENDCRHREGAMLRW